MSGKMTELLTSAEMRAVEAMMIESGAVSGGELMRRAGMGVINAISMQWPDLGRSPQAAVVLCGPGNNGGDGFVIATELRARGWRVKVFLYGEAARLPADAAAAHRVWQTMGAVHRLAVPEPTEAELCVLAEALSPGAMRIKANAAAVGRAETTDAGTGPTEHIVIIDALFGTGLTRPLPGLKLALRLCEEAREAALVVAVDIPSGLCADAGRVLSRQAHDAVCLRADLTVTFHALKPGHLLAEGPDFCGEVVAVDIGLPDDPVPQVTPVAAPRFADIAKGQSGAGRTHKFSYGHAVVLSGGIGKGGAARLSARAALRIGAGLVTLVCPQGALIDHAALPDAIMRRSVRDADAVTQFLADPRITAVCIGPGLGLHRARPLVAAALARVIPTVLDADALSVWVDEPTALFAMLHPACVLTPHLGEFGRLFPDLAARLAEAPASGPAYSKLDAVRVAARRAGCVVLLKGPDTVIGAPDGRMRIHSAFGNLAAPWLATAGAGDVLAGIITGLLARDMAPLDAAANAVWLHAAAARAFGPGLTADDLPGALPGVMRDLARGGV